MNGEREETRTRRSGRVRLKRIASRFALLFTSLVVALLLAEALLRVIGQSPRPPLTLEEGRPPESGEIRSERNALLGWVFPSRTAGEFLQPGSRTPVRTNELGLRGRSLDADGRASHVLMLGDSYVFGWGVPEEESLPYLLETLLAERLPDHPPRVINAGIPGYSVYQQRRMLRAVLERVSVDLVVATFSLANDGVDELRIRQYAPGRLEEYSPILRAPASPIARLARHSALIDQLDRRTRNLQLSLTNASPRARTLAEESLRGLIQDCSECGLPLVLVVVPLASEVKPGGLSRSLAGLAAKRGRAMVEKVADELDVATVDPKLALRSAREAGPVYLPFDPHWNAVGNRVVAEAVLDTVAAAMQTHE